MINRFSVAERMDRIVLAAGADEIMISRFFDIAGVKQMQLIPHGERAAGISAVAFKSFSRFDG